MRQILTAIVFVVLLPICSGSLFAQTNGPDSGVYGAVPNYEKDLKAVEGDIEFDIESVKAGNSAYSKKLHHDQAILEDWRNHCIVAYYADSALPDGYSLLKHRGQSGTFGLFGACADPVQSPRGYLRAAAWTACNPDGSFRLPLSSGKYAIFVGREERYDATGASPREDVGLSLVPWHRVVSVVAHEWKQLSRPNVQRCNSDDECSNGDTCQAGLPPSCQPVKAPQIPPYTSGLRGRIGEPRKICIGTIFGLMFSSEWQCIEAFAKDTGKLEACAACRNIDHNFAMPLKPGRYILKYPNAFEDPNHALEESDVEIKSDKWLDFYVMGAKPGPVKPPCWGGSIE